METGIKIICLLLSLSVSLVFCEKKTTTAPNELLVATYCSSHDDSFQLLNSYMSPLTHSWMPDPLNSTCLKTPSELLSLCQRLYPSKTINNVVESTHLEEVKMRTKGGSEESVQKLWIKPHKCLESPFQSEALLVPNSCLFDHLHNSSCWAVGKWSGIADKECEKRKLSLKSYGILLPCGVGLFSGVEFVCCPQAPEEYTGNESSEEDDDDDYDYDKESSSSSTTPKPTTPEPTVDPYYQKYNVHNEHQNFLDAEERQESRHKSRINHVIHDWNLLEEKYQGMRVKDPSNAEDFKKEVTLRFQKTIKSLEDESLAEKKQLLALHQQRIQSHLNEKKKEAMECFTQSLNERPQNIHRIRKCLQKLIRILYKDRYHTIHLLKKMNEDDEFIVHRLNQISHTGEETLKMLERYPKLNIELKPLIEDYIESLEGRDGYKLLSSDAENWELVRSYKKPSLIPLTSKSTPLPPPSTSSLFPSTPPPTELVFTEEPLVHSTPPPTVPTSSPPPQSSTDEEYDERNNRGAEAVYDNTPHHSHLISNEFQQDARTFSIHREVYHSNKAIYLVMSFGGIIIFVSMVIGLIILRRRGQSTRNYDFLAVNPTHGFEKVPTHCAVSPEEKHVYNMQMNGYENPTYKYFENK